MKPSTQTAPELIALNKPFGVLCQFSRDGDRPTLADLISIPHVYPAGRLDTDSEGLVLLTNIGALQHRLAHPDHKLPKTYWVQVEGEISDEALSRLSQGITLRDGPTLPATAARLATETIPPERDPPVRFRKSVPTSWISLTLREGRNRQVRRMTAAVGFPTLRLIRVQIGPYSLNGIDLGAWKRVDPAPIR